MKEIKLTQGKFAIVDDEDFELLSNAKWHVGKSGYPATSNHLGGRGKNRPIMMHAVILKLKKGEIGDHKDGNILNNQRSNLRKCTKQQNGMNKAKSIGKSSVYKGVRAYKGGKKFSTQIMINNKYIHLGIFFNETEAAQAYDRKAKELFGEFARLNFPKESA